MRMSSASFFTISNSLSRSRGAFFTPGFCFFRFTHPLKGWAERRESYGCLRGTRWACTLRGRPGAGEAPCVLRRTLASRRSTVAVFGSGAALSLTGLAFGSVPASSSHRVVVPGGGVPDLPGQRLPAAAAGRHASLRPLGSSHEHALR